MNRKAFTLIELLVVVAIIGILAAVGVTTFGGFQEKAKKAAVKSNHKLAVKQIQTEIIGAEIRGKMKKWDNANPGSCILVDIPSRSDLWVHIGLEAFNCLSQDSKKYKNPINPNDSEGAFWGSWAVPNISQAGRTACNHDGNTPGKIICNSRWGTGANDYDTTIINQP